MKKIYILSMIGFGALAVNAQNTGKATTTYKKSADENSVSVVEERAVKTNPRNFYGFGKTEGVLDINVGTTRWANQTGGAPYRRVQVMADGKVSVTWTASTLENPITSSLSRGSGYNHFNGTTWGPVNGARIEQQRTGFPNIALSPSNKEIIISHRVDTNGASKGLVFNQNQEIGSNTWSSNIIFAPPTVTTPSQLWPRIAVAGDYMIVVANYQDSTDDQPNFVTRNGMRAPMVYSRYQFSTDTWVTQDATFPGYDSSLSVVRRGSNDNYSIDANGNTVAVVLSDIFSNTVLWKSTDAGATWTKFVIDSFPPNIVLNRDTIEERIGSDGSPSLLVDGDGRVHYFSGKVQISDTIMNDGLYTYTFSRFVGIPNTANDGILYWNDTEKVLRQIANTPKSAFGDSAIAAGSFRNTDRRYEISNATWPSAAISSDGTIYAIFSGLTPGDVTTGSSDDVRANFRDIYAFYSTDKGATWSTPVNLTSYIEFNREEAFPNLARRADNKLHISYMLKAFPGITTADETYNIRYYSIPTDRVKSGAIGLNETENTLFAVSSNYPNPFNGSTIIPVELTQKTNVTIRVYNVLGEEVFTKTYNNTLNGLNEFEISGNFNSGFYIYTVEAGGYTVSGKMLAE